MVPDEYVPECSSHTRCILQGAFQKSWYTAADGKMADLTALNMELVRTSNITEEKLMAATADMLPHHSAPDGAVQPFWPKCSYKTIATSRVFKQRLRLHYKGLDYDLQYRYCVETAQVYVCTRKYYDVMGLLKPPRETWKDYIELDKCEKGYYLPGEGRLQQVNAAQAAKRRERRARQGTLALPREVAQAEAALATDQQEHWTGSSWSAPTAASQQSWWDMLRLLHCRQQLLRSGHAALKEKKQARRTKSSKHSSRKHRKSRSRRRRRSSTSSSSSSFAFLA